MFGSCLAAMCSDLSEADSSLLKKTVHVASVGRRAASSDFTCCLSPEVRPWILPSITGAWARGNKQGTGQDLSSSRGTVM